MARSSGIAAGTAPLHYYIGSGSVARSLVTAVDGFLFQSPLTYYAARDGWELSPGFAGAKPAQMFSLR